MGAESMVILCTSLVIFLLMQNCSKKFILKTHKKGTNSHQKTNIFKVLKEKYHKSRTFCVLEK